MATLGTDPVANGQRFPAIEGVRAFAALAIVAYHIGEIGMTHGQLARLGPRLTLGVPVFFVVSAFVLYRPFVASRSQGDPTPAIGPFLMRRVARIVPLYWVTLTVVWWTCPLFSAQTREQFLNGAPLWRYYLFAQVYDEASSLGALGPAWSLNVEMAFYLVLPLWGVAAAWLLRRRVPVHLELAALGLVTVGAMALHQRWSEAGSYLARTPPANAGYFAIGMVLAILSVDLGSTRPILLSRVVRLVVPVAATAVGLILAVFFFAPRVPHFDLFQYALVVLVLLPAAFDDRTVTIAKRILLQRHVQVIGVLSYGVYLFHRQVALGLRLWFWAPFDTDDFLVALGAVVALTVALATVSYRHLELPLVRRARLARQADDTVRG